MLVLPALQAIFKAMPFVVTKSISISGDYNNILKTI
jgi:hypothetical protein